MNFEIGDKVYFCLAAIKANGYMEGHIYRYLLSNNNIYSGIITYVGYRYVQVNFNKNYLFLFGTNKGRLKQEVFKEE